MASLGHSESFMGSPGDTGILHQLVQSRCCRTLSCVTVPFLFAVAVGSFTLNVPRVVAVSLFVPTRPLSIRPKTIFRFAVPRFSTANLGGSILSPLVPSTARDLSLCRVDAYAWLSDVHHAGSTSLVCFFVLGFNASRYAFDVFAWVPEPFASPTCTSKKERPAERDIQRGLEV
ncbi:hypothetical protein SCLCIDRAFT_1221150 [Scleroderma citrinum Foug A]|uniref:Uncharacterized protein n=1 Tax=Scleroderma citrinum Foug A TaxID=1036808 RepID=A0A0C3DHA0_9AGAM|nr:hypothetical protein SCLCIDRAFT_1221150 [Scleroderma citrinum Foug A]